MAFGNAAADEVLGDSFLLCYLFHLFSDDTTLGICDYTHIIQVAVKTR